MERKVFTLKENRSCGGGGGGGDRFIARRSLLRPEWCTHKPLDHTSNTSVFENLTNTKGLKSRNYINYLNRALGLPPQKSVLKFHQTESTGLSLYSPDHTWPCRPRKSPCMGSADSVLDLPNYGGSYWNHEVVDWGRQDRLLAALGNKVYVWSWRRQSLLCGAVAASAVNCAKFSPAHDDLIAVAVEIGSVETFHVETGKPVSWVSCHGYARCVATALDWSSTGKAFVLGCSKGTLTAYDGGVARIARRARAHASAVLRVRVSPDARYLASVAYGETSVRTWTWPHLKPYYILENTSIVKSIAWHPWRSSMLGIGGSCAQSGVESCVLAVWDVAPARLREPPVKSDRAVAVDCMLFSAVTGEMVISCWMQDETAAAPEGHYSRIMVLGGADHEVDTWRMPDRVTALMFSPDGHKLAMATTEEDLVILYFLPELPKKKNINTISNHSRLAVMMDEAETGFCVR